MEERPADPFDEDQCSVSCDGDASISSQLGPRRRSAGDRFPTRRSLDDLFNEQAIPAGSGVVPSDAIGVDGPRIGTGRRRLVAVLETIHRAGAES
jgi:hypothetical protein